MTAFAQLDYRYRNLGFNVEFAQNLTDIFKYDAEDLGRASDYYYLAPIYSLKPTSIFFKFIYFLQKSKKKEEN